VTATTEEEIAEDFLGFFQNFQNIFGIKKFKIYITGESYAGRYVPYISAAMLNKKNKDYFNLSGEFDCPHGVSCPNQNIGALVYDPCIGSYVYTQEEAVTVPFIVQNNNMIGLNASYIAQLEELDKTCGYAEYREKYLTFPASGVQPPKYFDYDADAACDVADTATNAAFGPNPCFNSYEINTQCPMPSDPLGFPTDIEYVYTGLSPIYFDRTDVKKAMHAPLNVDWAECSGPVFIGDGGPEDEGDLSADPIQKVLPQVIEATNRVLIANGALDMIIITNGTLLSIQNMTWHGKLGFQSQPSTPIVITLPDLQYGPAFAHNGIAGLENPQGTMGVQHYERGLMWAETFLSGHMQPQFQPRSSYRHLQWLLGHIDTL
jgi:carboxypeptidase D